MCGICGVIPRDREKPVEEGLLRAMAGTMVHRGPDEEGYYSRPGAGLGFRRLSIVDLVAGSQPMSNETNDIWIVFNGEIYNHEEIRKELLQCSHTFRTRCDTEAILHAYEEYGEGCVNRLRGMFAFAIWDEKKRTLFMARDRMGIKPFYYHVSPERFVFASEIKAIVGTRLVEPAVDFQALYDYLTFRYVPGPRTLFSGIMKLQPGHTATLTERGFETKPYWDISYEKKSAAGFEENKRILLELLEESVRLRLMSDVPLGALLSGGVDSSTVVALMSRMVSQPVKTFSVGFDCEGEEGELKHAKAVAEKFGTDHHEIVIGAKEMLNYLPDLVWYQDEPVSEPAAIPTHLVCRLARTKVVVVLTGEGGDELFGGYPKYAHDRLIGMGDFLPLGVRKLIDGGITRALPYGYRKLKVASRSLAQNGEIERWTSWFAGFSGGDKDGLLTGDFMEKARPLSSSRIFEGYNEKVRGAEHINRMLYADTKVWLPDDLLMKMDKMSMATSIEARVPLLDHKLVEFAATIPVSQKVSGFTGKYLLKKTVESILPPGIIDRKKVGFTVPIGSWLRNELRELMKDTLLSSRSMERGYFKPSAIASIVERHANGEQDFQREIWMLMNLELWHRKYIDCGTPEPLLSGAASRGTR